MAALNRFPNHMYSPMMSRNTPTNPELQAHGLVQRDTLEHEDKKVRTLLPLHPASFRVQTSSVALTW